MILILLIFTFIIIFYLLNLNYQYWKKRGVPGPKPSFLVGNLGPSFLLKKSLAQVYEDIYHEYKEYPLVGLYRSTTPTLLICDPEVIKDVTVKSFNHFTDNDLKIDKKIDPLFGRNPFVLGGEEWKTTRVHLTPAFTSGKIKSIYPILQDISEQLVKFISKQSNAINGEGYEAKELSKRFTLNNVGSCAFGLEAKCFVEENSEFKQIADRFLSTDAFQMVKVFLVSMIPALKKIVSIKFTPRDVEEKLTDIVKQTLQYRSDNNIVRNDYLHVLQQLKNSAKEEEFSDIDITAHAAGFFVDGYETSSIVMSFMLYELAANPESQAKLREEVTAAFEENGGKLPYEVLQSLPYLEGAFNEALRLHPALGSLNKMCTQSYTYIPKNSTVIKQHIKIEEGTPIILPVYGLHRDPKYFKDPNCFKPERFIGENKENVIKYSFLPFGEGPRACLGKRFGSLQVKIGVAYIIKNYELSVNKRTRVPIKYDPVYFMSAAQGGLWLDFKKIV